jgi:hypothetical protein
LAEELSTDSNSDDGSGFSKSFWSSADWWLAADEETSAVKTESADDLTSTSDTNNIISHQFRIIFKDITFTDQKRPD